MQTPAMSGLRQQRRRHRAVARQELQHVFRHAGFVQQLHRGVADQDGLIGRLGDDGVAGGERGGDLADEDREREIPRADADEHAAAVQRKLVAIRRSGRAAASGWPNSLRAIARVVAAGSRRLRGLRRSASGRVLPASRTHSATNSARRCSSRSAACSRIFARDCGRQAIPCRLRGDARCASACSTVAGVGLLLSADLAAAVGRIGHVLQRARRISRRAPAASRSRFARDFRDARRRAR